MLPSPNTAVETVVNLRIASTVIFEPPYAIPTAAIEFSSAMRRICGDSCPPLLSSSTN